ncbi:Ankyrin [Chitinispirillum alkaliphilum]|nr:Ankyrin [Chitinispirillum alkaliphilum]
MPQSLSQFIALLNMRRMKAEEFFSKDMEIEFAKAIERGNTKKMRSIINNGLDINAQGKDGINFLTWAFLKFRKDSFEFLIRNGADPNLKNDRGYSVVAFAAMAKDIHYLQLLLRNGADPNTTVPLKTRPILSVCVAARKKDFVELLIRFGADINLQDKGGYTPMAAGMVHNQYDTIYRLLKLGADPTLTDRFGRNLYDMMKTQPDNLNEEFAYWKQKVTDFLAEYEW